MKLQKIFLKYCLKNIAVFFVLLGCCLLMADTAYRSVETYVVKTNELRLQEGVNEISQNISKMDLMSQIVKQDIYFNSLAHQKGELSLEQSLNLKYANQQLTNLGFVYSFSPYGFAMFQHNNLYISTSQCSFNFLDYYGKFLEVNAGGPLTAQEFKAQLFQRAENKISFWKVDSLQCFASGKYLTVEDAILCIIKSDVSLGPTPSYVMTFVIRPQDVIQKILTTEVRECGFIQVKDTKDNTIILNSGENIDDLDVGGMEDNTKVNGIKYRILTYSVENLGWEVTIGFPQSLIRRQSKDVGNLLRLYIGIGGVLVLGLTLYLSYRQYSNVKRLFFMVSGENRYQVKGQDEYDTLCRILGDITENRNEYKRQMDMLHQQNRAILLENLIVRGINTKEEREAFETCFAKPLEFYCVVLLKMSLNMTENHPLALLCIVEYLKDRYPNDFANVHTGANDELFLLSLSPTDASTVQGIKTLFEEIIMVLTEDMNITFNVGISAIGTELSNVNTCYNQARQVNQAYYREHENTVEVYSIDINSARENVVGMEFLDKLYNLLLCAERDLIQAQFVRLVGYCQKLPFQYETQKQQIFFSIRNVIYSAYLRLAAGTQDYNWLPNYKNTYTIEEMANDLAQSACRFCDCMEEGKKSRNIDLKDRILQYVQTNYSVPSMTAGVVCREIGISEKYLCQFIKEQTGETFASFLERIRVQEAVAYLTTTDYSNEKIAELTGFAAVNTFYRVFHKRIGVSPGVYRSNHSTLL